jgi:PKD repeat protein
MSRPATKVPSIRIALILGGIALWALPGLPFDEVIQVVPAQPSDADPVEVRVTGTWSNACVPELETTRVLEDERTVVVEAASNPQCGFCSFVVTDYAVAAPLGRALSAGQWRVEFRVRVCDDPYEVVAATTFQVAESLSADFTWSPTTPGPGQPVQFSDQSSGGPSSWQWSFGDGATSQQSDPSHTYATSGTYTVSLTVSNENGSDTLSQQLTVGEAPEAAFTYSPARPAVGEPVQFSDASTGGPSSWSWGFGDGATSGQRNPSHTYATAGPKTVTLTVSNSFGDDQTSQVIEVDEAGEVVGGDENQATPPGTNVDERIASATDANGNRIIVWTDNRGKGLTADGLVKQGEDGLFARFFDPDEVPGDTIIVERSSGGVVDTPTVSFDNSGRFVIGWRRGLLAKQGEDGIFARRFSPDREPIGESFQIDEGSGDELEAPSVATNRAGDFFVAWRVRIGKQGEDGLFGRAFGRDGEPQGPAIRIDAGAPGVEEISSPSVSTDASGNYFVTWHQRSAFKQGEDGIFGRQFDPEGEPSGAPFQVSTDPEGEPGDPDVAVDAQGDAIVVWRQDIGGSSGVVVLGRTYRRGGVATSEPFVVNSEVAGSQTNPSVAATPAGDYVVAWESTVGGETGISGRFFTSDGRPVGGDFEVASRQDTSMPSAPEVSVANDRTVTVAYARQQGSTRSVHYRTFDVVTGGSDCGPTVTAMCLNQDRFQVEVNWRDFANATGAGRAVRLTNDTGYFWFFNQANVELMVKVLDGRAVNGNYWVYYGALSNVEYTITVTDTVTGSSVTYFNPSGTFASVGDTRAIPGDGKVVHTAREFPGTDGSAMPSVGAVWSELLDEPFAQGDCQPSDTSLCLNSDRFRVEASWRDFQNNSGVARAAPLTGDTGTFWFFNEDNVELILKVLDGRVVNGHFWVFYGALSNVEFTITVTDTETGRTRRYTNPLGGFGSVGDTTAFSSP